MPTLQIPANIFMNMLRTVAIKHDSYTSTNFMFIGIGFGQKLTEYPKKYVF